MGAERRQAVHHGRGRRRVRNRHGPGRGAGAAEGATMFLVNADYPAGRSATDADHDAGTIDGHCHVRFGIFSYLTTRCSVGGPRVRLRAGPAGARPADPLHALAGRGGARRRRGPGAPGAGSCSAPPAVARPGPAAHCHNEIELGRVRALLGQTVAQVAQGTKGTEGCPGPRSSSARRPAASWTGRFSWPAAPGTPRNGYRPYLRPHRRVRIYDGPSKPTGPPSRAGPWPGSSGPG